MRLAHCTDVHLLRWNRSVPLELGNKRAFGALNIAISRRRKLSNDIFYHLLNAACEAGAERLLISGDLTNLALESELRHAAAILRNAPLPVIVIPGNHDAYERRAHQNRRFEHHFGAFMPGTRAPDSDYPFTWREGRNLALIGVSTAIPTAPLMATGEIGSAQLMRLEQLLDQLANEGRRRVLMIHHPPLLGLRRHRRLRDADALTAVLAKHGAELILCGHEHRLLEATLPGPGGPIPVHGLPPATSRSRQPERQAMFAIYDLNHGILKRELYGWNGMCFLPLAST
jgi:3',5'-cyclic AMP phosphodiesterase CpdA